MTVNLFEGAAGGPVDAGGSSDPGAVGGSVVFVLGITRRSGTNYLSNLIYLHPECDRVSRIWEDFTVSGAALLDQYVERVSGQWDCAGWRIGAAEKDRLWARLGNAIVLFLRDHRERRVRAAAGDPPKHPKWVVAKTPSVENLALAGRFPGSRTVVIVRDGRSVVSSGMKGFGWDFHQAARRWAAAADSIVNARRAGHAFLLVRYEDLLLDLRSQMQRTLAFLELDASRYDMGAAENLPLTGSSFVPGVGQGVYWGKAPRNNTADLLNRFQGWTEAMHLSFNRIAGERMRQFGYELVLPASPRWTVARRLAQLGRSVARRFTGRRRESQ